MRYLGPAGRVLALSDYLARGFACSGFKRNIHAATSVAKMMLRPTRLWISTTIAKRAHWRHEPATTARYCADCRGGIGSVTRPIRSRPPRLPPADRDRIVPIPTDPLPSRTIYVGTGKCKFSRHQLNASEADSHISLGQVRVPSVATLRLCTGLCRRNGDLNAT